MTVKLRSSQQAFSMALPHSLVQSLLLVIAAGFLSWLGCVRATDVETCQANAWPSHRPDANVRFAILLSKNFNNFDQDATQTCEITTAAVQHYLAVEWAVDRINQANNGSGFIPGISFGFDVLNDCSIPERAARNSLSFSNRYLPYGTADCTSKATNSTQAGFIMISKSTVAQKVASITNDLSVPVISATATLPELSDRQQYPNFFRTVPSDIHQMTLIADILKTLTWTYVVVVYQDDLYGNSGLKILQQKALDRNICIHKTLKLPGNSIEITKEFVKILPTAKGRVITVVVIADVKQTQNLLCTSLPTTSTHIIMTEAVSKYVFKDCTQSSWTFTISTDANAELNDLKSYINNKHQSQAQSVEKHPVIAEYLKLATAPKTGPLVGDELAPFITSTIHAVFALVDSVRVLHKETCGDQAELCDLMKTKLDENRLLELLKTNKVDYTQMDAGVPPDDFRKFAFTFDQASGDIHPQSNLTEYMVYFLHNKQYKNVGSYLDGKLDLQVSKMKDLAGSDVPSSVCDGRCDTCLHNGKIPIVFLEGDVYIVGILSIHESNVFECGEWRKTGNDAFVAEGFIHAIQLLRERTGINFGAIGFDACYSPLRIMSELTDFMSNINPTNSALFPSHVQREKIVGAVGCRSSGCTIASASIFQPLKIPQISYASSSPDLDDRINYPYFLRTVPSDVSQAQVMVNIIKLMGWEYVGLLYVKNNYGAKGMQAFRNIVDQEGSGICVPPEFGINVENDESVNNDVIKAYGHFLNLQVKVVVFFGIDERIKSFVQVMEENDLHGNFIFLASEEWGNNKKITDAGIMSSLGSITLKVQQVGLQSENSFREHLKTKKLSSDDVNIWYGEFWQNLFKCNIKGGLINEFDRDCDPSQTLSDTQINELVSDQRLTHVINAVFAMGNAFKSIKDNQCQGRFPCEYLTENANSVVEVIREQRLTVGQQVRDIFDKNRNGAIGFDVFNIQSTDKGATYAFKQIGTFFSPQSNNIDTNDFKFYDKEGNPSTIDGTCPGTKCSSCKHRPKVSEPVTTEKPVVQSQSGTDFKDSEILIISLIIILFIALAIVGVVLYICYKRRCTAFEKKMLNDEQIYAEPDRQVFPGPYNTTMPVFSDPNFSPYQDSYHTTSNVGLNNLAYAPDSENVDSVSVVAMRRQTHSDIHSNAVGISDDSGDNANQRYPVSENCHVSVPPVPHFSGRPLPSTAIGRKTAVSDSGVPMTGNVSPIAQPRLTRESLPETNQYANRNVSPSHISMFSPSSGMHDPNTGSVIMTVPYSSSSHPPITTRQMSDPVTYYIRDANGQLTALTQPAPYIRTSSRSDASSSVIPEYGPYSDAHNQKKLMLKKQISQTASQSNPQAIPHSPYVPQHMIAVPVNPTTASNMGIQYELVELKDISTPQSPPQPYRGSHNHPQAIAETPMMETSPIHYASPVHAPNPGHVDASVAIHHQDPNASMAAGDPTVNPVIHFRQVSDPHGQLEHPAVSGTQMQPQGDKFYVNDPDGTVDVPEVHNRDNAHQYVDQPTSVPDVISSSPAHGPPQTVISHIAHAGELENAPQGHEQLQPNVSVQQPSHAPIAELPMTLSHV